MVGVVDIVVVGLILATCSDLFSCKPTVVILLVSAQPEYRGVQNTKSLYMYRNGKNTHL